MNNQSKKFDMKNNLYGAPTTKSGIFTTTGASHAASDETAK